MFPAIVFRLYLFRTCITMWSSGTGFSGVLGYGWYVIFTLGFRSTFAVACYAGNIVAIGFYLNFLFVLGKPTLRREVEVPPSDLSVVRNEHVADMREDLGDNRSKSSINVCNDKSLQNCVLELTFYERIRHTLALWPFMVPLFVVYFSEYAMQSGMFSIFIFLQLSVFPLVTLCRRHLIFVIRMLGGNWLPCGKQGL